MAIFRLNYLNQVQIAANTLSRNRAKSIIQRFPSFPNQYDEYIQRLSRYMASNGRHYANHYATIRKWLDEDNRGKSAKNYTYDDYNEGECL